jgi:hypothetical protein
MNTNDIVRIIRGIVGVLLVIFGIMYESIIAFPGFLLVFSALTGRCGFGNTSCEVKTQKIPPEKE